MESGYYASTAISAATVSTTKTGSFQNQQRRGDAFATSLCGRKRGIAALLQDVSNISQPGSRTAARKAMTAMAGQTYACIARGNSCEGGRQRQDRGVSACEDRQCSFLHDMVQDGELLGRLNDNLSVFIQRNVTHEVQKAFAFRVFLNALIKLNWSIAKAAEHASDCFGYNPRTIRRWAWSFLSSASTCAPDELDDDEHMLELLASNRGHDNNHTHTLVHNEDFAVAARAYVRSNACKKDEPNLTCKMFSEWIKMEYDTHVHETTAGRWLVQLGFSRVHHQKGVYFDGHDRSDVVEYREEFIKNMHELDKKSITCFGNTPQLAVGERPLIRVTHDECTYYANCDQSFFWADDKTNLRQKSLGACIIVSDFVDEVSGFLRDGLGEARLLV